MFKHLVCELLCGAVWFDGCALVCACVFACYRSSVCACYDCYALRVAV